MTSELRRNALLLGALTAVGGLGIDMYLPALPAMAADLHASIGTTQLTLSAYLLALALGQPFYGPLSDMVGRQRPLRIGLAVFLFASIGCALARDISLLIGLRFVQGLGASALMVVSRAVVRDLSSGATAVRLLSIMIAVVGVAPILSPLLGGFVAETLSWRLLFVGLAILAGIALPLMTRLLPETHPPALRTPALAGFAVATRELLGDWRFVGLILLPGLTQAATFAFVASSAFVFVGLLHMSPGGYSLIFAVTSLALIGGAQFAGGMVERHGAERVILTAVAIAAAASLLLLGAILADRLTLGLTCLVFLLTFASVGFIGSPASVLALEPHDRISGTAAALAGTAQLLLSAIGSALASALAGETALPLAIVMSGGTVAALAVAIAIYRASRPAAVALSSSR